MTEIKSTEVTVKGSEQEIFDFLIDLNNLVQLLPQDKISEWESSNERCSFKIQNAATIELVLDKAEAPNTIYLVSGERAPFKFTLDIHISGNSDSTCTGYIHFKGDMNPFIKMMAERPLTNLFEYMGNQLVAVREQS